MTEEKEDSLAYEYTQSTTLHGIARVTDKEKSLVKRIVWAILFLACSALFLYFLCHAFIKYFDYPVTTKLTYQTHPKMDFPSVTICNYNAISADYLAKKNDPMLNATVDYFSLLMNPFTEAPELSEELANYIMSVDAEEFYSQGAHQADITYFYCTLHGTISQQCDLEIAEGFIVRTRTDMGVCHTFHPQSYIEATGKAEEISRAGRADGLSVTIDVQQDKYRFGAITAGVQVLVHDPKVEPAIYEVGTALHPGTEVNLAIKKTDMISLPAPYADKDDSCLDTEDPGFVNPLKYHDYYSYEACEQEGFVQTMYKSCNCVMYFYEAPGLPICNLFDSNFCIPKVFAEYYNNRTSSSGCLKQCHEVVYEVSMSHSQFPNNQALKDVQRQWPVDEQYFRDNVIRMNVYFGELGVQTVKQEKGYTLQSAIAEIGGYLGLCLGASILTLCEFLQLFWDYCERCANTERRNKNSVGAFRLDEKS